MRRNLTNDSDDENEIPKTAVRKTRAALAAATAEASPMRRSTRIRQGSVNRDGSSPESLTGSHAAPPVTRVTRRRAAAAAEASQFLDVSRSLRSRKNSVSSNVSEITEIESVPGTPKKQYKRLVTIQSSPDTPKPTPRRSTRATSEAKSPTPTAPTTRRTRATSNEPEPIAAKAAGLAQAASSIGTPTRRRRTQVSAPPTEPPVSEDANEDGSEDANEDGSEDKLDNLLEVPEETQISSGKKSSRKSSSSSAKKSPRNESRQEESNVDPEVDESIEKEKSLEKNETVDDEAEELELLKTPREIQMEDLSGLDNADGETVGKQTQKNASPIISFNKRVSLDKSKELGVQIEGLLNKSTEELANSPRDKENQKVNISPEKVRKNLEVIVSNVNIVRGKPGGFNVLANKSFEKTINSWLDDRGLSKSRYETVSPRSVDVEENNAESSQDSNSEKKSPKKIDKESKEEGEAAETGKKNVRARKSFEKKINSWLDDRGLSKSRYETVSPKSVDVEENEAESSQDSNSEKKSLKKIGKESKEEGETAETGKKNVRARRSFEKKINSSLDERGMSKSLHEAVSREPFDIEENKIGSSQFENKSPKKIDKESEEERETTESGKKKKKSRINVHKTVVDTEVIEEFTLSDSDDRLNDSQSEFSLAVEDDNVDEENKNKSLDDLSKSNEFQNSKKSKFGGNSDDETDSDPDEDILEESSSSKHDSSKNKGKDIQENSPIRRSHVILKRVEDEREDERRASVENKRADKLKESELKSKASEEKKNSSNDNLQDEAMDTNEHEETEPSKDSTAEALEIDLMSFEESESVANKKNQSLKADDSKTKSIIDSELDSDAVVDTLFHNISAEEWKKNKNQKNRQSRRKSSLAALSQYDSEEDDLVTVGARTLEEEATESESDSEDTLILKKPVDKKRKSVSKAILEEAETRVKEVEEEKSQKRRKSLNKSAKSNTSLVENEIEVEKGEDSNRKSISKSQVEKGDAKIDEKSRKAEAVPVTVENLAVVTEDEKVVEKKQPGSAKKTPKSQTKTSNKSPGVIQYPVSSGSENEDDEEKTSLVNEKLKSAKKNPKTPLDRNYSTIVEVDSDSVQDNVSDSDGSGNQPTMPSFLFTVPSSNDEDEDYNPNRDADESNNTIDSDIAKDLNLAGDDDLQYSDDDVQADECRDSESEHSDEEDVDSDMADFVVPDNETESSAASEEEEENISKSRFKRIMDKSSSEDEQEENEQVEETEENHEEEIESPVEASVEKQERRSLGTTPNGKQPVSESPALSRKTLEYSPDSARKSLSSKKSKKKSEGRMSPDVKEDLNKSVKKLKSFTGSVKALLNQTVDLCTPEATVGAKTDKKSSEKHDKSIDKLRKNLVEDLGASTPDHSEAKEEGESKTPKSKTLTNEKDKRSRQNTPESVNKINRDSIQLIKELGSTSKAAISDLNKTMLTPNSETPVTKFLKKERLNESLPLIELKKKRTKSFDKQALSQMNEDEQEDEEPSENNEQKEVSEESGDEESDANEEAEENGDDINTNGHRDDEEEDGTDEEPSEDKQNGVEVDENEKDDEEDKEESSEEEEISVKIHVAEKKRNSKGCKSLTEEPKEKPRRESQGRASTSSALNGKAESEEEEEITLMKKSQISSSTLQVLNKKKRARLESSGTPRSLKKTKKIKIVSETEENDSDEAPESLGFGEARTEALQAMKEMTESLRAGKEAKKKKRRDQLERIRQEKETKATKKSEMVKTNLKRLPEDLLDNLSDVPQRPKKKRKLSKKEEPILPSRQMFSPGKTPDILKIEDADSPVSTGGATTHFSVINLEKVKKQPKKAVAAASFREQMLARNPRQPVSAFMVYKAKQKASGKQLFSRK